MIFEKIFKFLTDKFRWILRQLHRLSTWLYDLIHLGFETILNGLSTLFHGALGAFLRLFSIVTAQFAMLLTVFSTLKSFLNLDLGQLSSMIPSRMQSLVYVLVSYCSIDVLIDVLLVLTSYILARFAASVAIATARIVITQTRGSGM